MTNEQQSELWHYYNRFYKSRVKAYSHKINKALKAQVRQYIDARDKGKSDAASLMAVTFEPMLTALKPLYRDASITYGAKTIAHIRKQKARMPIGFNELMIQLVTRYFEVELLNDVNDITQTTRDQIQEVLTRAYPLGWSYDEIVSELVSDVFTAARARLIARTETCTASNAGAMMAAKTTGLKYDKVWIAARDNRTRRIPRDAHDHLHMDGVTIPYEDLFQVNGIHGVEQMLQPGDRKHGADAGNICNCRCTVGMIPVRVNGRLVTV